MFEPLVGKTAWPQLRRLVPALATALMAVARVHASDTQDLLKRADAFRLTAAEAEVRVRIDTLVSGRLDRTRDYLVLLKPGRRSLVISQSAVEKGQKVLMLEDDFWIILPSSERPIRITPVQKLLGEASAGDIAEMTWSDDYEGQQTGTQTLDKHVCGVLELNARYKGSTYKRIVLWLDATTSEPVRADLYLASGKLAKTARFEMGELAGRHQVTAMDLVDQIQTNRVTRISYLEQKARPVPDTLLNPMDLVHANLH